MWEDMQVEMNIYTNSFAFFVSNQLLSTKWLKEYVSRSTELNKNTQLVEIWDKVSTNFTITGSK